MKTTGRYIFLLCAVAAGASCSRGRPDRAAAEPRREPPLVTIVQSHEELLARTIQVVGTLVGNEEVVVSSEGEGQVSRVSHDFGDSVAPGQVLAVVDPTELDMRVRQAQAGYQEALAKLGVPPGSERIPPPEAAVEVQQAKAQLDDAQVKLRRIENLFERGVVSQQSVDDAKTTHTVAATRYQAAVHQYQNLVASAQQARANLDWNRKKAGDTVVRAPIAGIVQEKLVSRGEYVRVNQPLFKIVSINPVKLRAQVMEKDVQKIRGGMKTTVNVDAFPNLNFPGTVSRIAPAVEEKSRTLTIEAVIPNRGGSLKPGLFARASIPVGSQHAVMVPQAAVISIAGIKKVFVVQNGIARERVVEPGVASGEWIEIKSGVNRGESVAVNNLRALSDGLSVKAQLQ